MKVHLYTKHDTYTGKGCAVCGKDSDNHDPFFWLVNGEKVDSFQESYFCVGESK